MGKAAEGFLLAMQAEGVPPHVARLVMRHAATCYRLQVAEANGDAPYGKGRPPVPDPFLRPFARLTELLEPYGIKPVVSALDVRLQTPSKRDEGWGGVFVPRGARS